MKMKTARLTLNSRTISKWMFSLCCSILLLPSHDGRAAFYFWDPNGTETPTGGTWDTTSAQWSTDAGPSGSPVVWDPTAVAVFAVTNSPGGTSTNYGTFNINVDSAIGIGGILNNGINGSTPATNVIFSGTGSFTLAPGVNVISVGNGVAGGGGGINNIFRVPITGPGTVEFQAATGSEYLTVPNTYTGGTTISTRNGINISANNVFGTGTVTINPTLDQIVFAMPANEPASAGGLPFATAPISIPNDFIASTGVAGKVILVGHTNAPTTFSGNWDMGTLSQTLDFRTATIAAPTTMSGVISGSGTMFKTGNGVLVLSGANTYTGKTHIQNGTLSVSSLNSVVGGTASSALGAPTTVANGTIGLGSGTTAGVLRYTGAGETTDRVVDLAGTTGGGTIQNDGTGGIIFTSDVTVTGAGAKALTLRGTNTGNNRINGIIANGSSATSVTKADTGTWTLAGANSYTGGTTVSAGRLRVGNNSALGTGKLTLGAATISSDSTTARTLSVAVDVTGNATLGNTTDSGTLTFQTGAWTLTGNRTVTANSAAVINSVIGEDATGGRKLTKAGSGKLTLGSANTFTGGFQINAGTVAIGQNGSIGNGLLTLNGGTFQGDGTTARVLNNAVTVANSSTIGGTAALTFQGGVTLTGNRTLTVNNTADTTINGVIGDSGAGHSFTKAGTGKLILSAANTYSGSTTVSAGTLALVGSGSVASITNTVATGATFDLTAVGGLTLSTGKRLQGGGTVLGNIVLGDGSTISPGTSPGTLTTDGQSWGGGATYLFEVNDATGTAGAGWDLINISGVLDIDATAGNEFEIDVTSLTLANILGDAANFNKNQSYAWRIATASGGITDFDATDFEIDTTGFSNDTTGAGLGNWFITQSGNDVFLNFAAVPEPSTIALGVMGGLAFVGAALRRRSRK